MQRHSSPWSGTLALHTLSGPASAPATAVRHVGAFLGRRCGTLEDAFSALDPNSSGSLTLETFARGMENLGYDSGGSHPLSETTRVFQAMDPASSGSVDLRAFLSVFADDIDELCFSARSRGLDDSMASGRGSRDGSTSMTTGPDSAGGGSVRKPMVAEDCRAASIAESELLARVTRLEARLDVDITRLREFCERASVRHAELLEARCLDVERENSRHTEVLEAKLFDFERVNARHGELLEAKYLDTERASARQAELLEAKCIETCTAASEDLKAKMEALREHVDLRLRDAELGATQQHVDLRAAMAVIESNIDSSVNIDLTVQRGVKDSIESVRSSVDIKLQALSAEMKSLLEEERTAKIESAVSMDLSRSSVDGKLQAFRQEMRTTLEEERTASIERIQSNMESAIKIIKSDQSTQREVKDHMDLVRSSMEGTIHAFRGEIRTALEEERRGNIERVRTLGHTLSEEFERSIVTQASAHARTEACAMATGMVAQEFETMANSLQKERINVQSELVGNVHSELSQFAERLSITEDAMKKQVVEAEARLRADAEAESRKRADAERSTSVETIRGAPIANIIFPKAANTARSYPESERVTPSSSHREIRQTLPEGSEKVALQAGMSPARLEHTLQAIIEKLDSQCIDGLAPDLKELNSLLNANTPEGDSHDLLKASIASTAAGSSTRDHFETFAASAAALEASAALRHSSPDSTQGSSTQGGEMQKLREDILGYLRTDFQQIVSTTLKDLGKDPRKAALDLAASIKADSSDDRGHGESVPSGLSQAPQPAPSRCKLPGTPKQNWRQASVPAAREARGNGPPSPLGSGESRLGLQGPPGTATSRHRLQLRPDPRAPANVGDNMSVERSKPSAPMYAGGQPLPGAGQGLSAVSPAMSLRPSPQLSQTSSQLSPRLQMQAQQQPGSFRGGQAAAPANQQVQVQRGPHNQQVQVGQFPGPTNRAVSTATTPRDMSVPTLTTPRSTSLNYRFAREGT